MKTVFVSQPMRGRTEEEILAERDWITHVAYAYLGDDVTTINNFTKPDSMTPVQCLGDSISMMATADLVVFAPGWRKARGCKIERMVAKEYQIPTLDLVIYNMPNKPVSADSAAE